GRGRMGAAYRGGSARARRRGRDRTAAGRLHRAARPAPRDRGRHPAVRRDLPSRGARTRRTGDPGGRRPDPVGRPRRAPCRLRGQFYADGRHLPRPAARPLRVDPARRVPARRAGQRPWRQHERAECAQRRTLPRTRCPDRGHHLLAAGRGGFFGDPRRPVLGAARLRGRDVHDDGARAGPCDDRAPVRGGRAHGRAGGLGAEPAASPLALLYGDHPDRGHRRREAGHRRKRRATARGRRRRTRGPAGQGRALEL
ncbi:MAG: Creatinine amidohydrolase, partial [uncultured Microvirga sp.]